MYKFRFLALIPALSASSTIRGYAGIRLWNARTGALRPQPAQYCIRRSRFGSIAAAAVQARRLLGVHWQAITAQLPLVLIDCTCELA